MDKEVYMTQENPVEQRAVPEQMESAGVNKDIGPDKPKISNNIKTGIRLILLLLIFIAAVQLYFAIQEVIRLWIADQFIPLVNGVYYLLVIAGGIWLIRETFIRGN
jgi:hypothetical protein